MRLTYDPRLGVGYIRLREPSGPVETICVSDELNVDLAPDGTIYSIELLNANEQLSADDFFRRVIESQKDWCKRVVFYDLYNSADYRLAYEHHFGPLQM